jgi:enterochelin esterase-like enzyme
MSLISPTFRDVVIALMVLAAVVTLVLWNRIPGPRPVRYAARGVLVLTGEALATLALLVSLNISYGGLVVSWSDLLGDQSTKGAQFSGQAGQVTLHPVATATVRSLTGGQRFTKAGYGGFTVTTLKGTKSGITSQVYVWLPPQYTEHPNEQFPVLELLHGVPDSPGAWMGPMHLAAHMEAAISSGKSHPYILVVPEVTPITDHSAPEDNEECSDISATDKLDTWLTGDVRTMVLDNFRAIDSASGWGLMGYSTGGFCAAKLVLQHPDLYRAAVSLSGYYLPESSLLTQNTRLDEQNSPQWLIAHTRTPAVSLLMTASKQDPIDPPSEAAQMLAAAKASSLSKATEVQQFIAPLGGGHNQSAWEKMLPTAFTWLSARLSAPVTPKAIGS